MAFANVPESAILRFHELSPKAAQLYVYYCLRRNSEGIAWPGLATIARDLKIPKTTVCTLRGQLAAKGWIEMIGGDSVDLVMGFRDVAPAMPAETKAEKEIKSASNSVRETRTEFEKLEQDSSFSNGEAFEKLEHRSRNSNNVRETRTEHSRNSNASFEKLEQTVRETRIAYKEEHTMEQTMEQREGEASAQQPAPDLFEPLKARILQAYTLKGRTLAWNTTQQAEQQAASLQGAGCTVEELNLFFQEKGTPKINFLLVDWQHWALNRENGGARNGQQQQQQQPKTHNGRAAAKTFRLLGVDLNRKATTDSSDSPDVFDAALLTPA